MPKDVIFKFGNNIMLNIHKRFGSQTNITMTLDSVLLITEKACLKLKRNEYIESCNEI